MSDFSPVSYYVSIASTHSVTTRNRKEEATSVPRREAVKAGGRRPRGRSARPSAGAHLLVWDAGCPWLLWKGYLNSSLLPLLPELTRITLMGLLLSPILPRAGGLRTRTGATGRVSEGARRARGEGNPTGTRGEEGGDRTGMRRGGVRRPEEGASEAAETPGAGSQTDKGKRYSRQTHATH